MDKLGWITVQELRKLRLAFKENGGSVTIGNSFGINDGAASLVLVSGDKALELGLKVIAKVSGHADVEHAPELFITFSALTIPKDISRAGLEAFQIDFYEINEAFARQTRSNKAHSKGYNQKGHVDVYCLNNPICLTGAPTNGPLDRLLKVSYWMKGVDECSEGRHVRMEGAWMEDTSGRHARMKGTSGWKAHPDGMHARMEALGRKARPDARRFRKEGSRIDH
uniref:Acetyl-CoA acetyltransferase, cytosolic 1-like n=1 Tax=Tanacetum cinerariifolium TaxID=118510 RepID=A0A6L2KV84_TANCI|nr:acetyl-CoA acetyltransferase, cytosolic 1-like [Tanacetum cinerariifolium]